MCAIVVVWVWAVFRVVETLVVVIGCVTEIVVGARGGTVEPLSRGVTWLHVGDVGAIERVVEAVLSLR